MRFPPVILVLLGLAAFCACRNVPPGAESEFSHFVGQESFSNYTRSRSASGEEVLLSPVIDSRIPWNELIVSWNAQAPAGSYLRIEASAIQARHRTRFYTMGMWSQDNQTSARTSVRGQKDADGDVFTDTLRLTRPAGAAQLRVTLGGPNGAAPTLKFLGLSFANTTVSPAARPPNREARGKIVATPEHSQHGSWTNTGWCSPTSLSMALSRWAEVLNRPELDLTVPQVAAKVYDRAFAGTGNWPFNTAFAGSFDGMRSYVTRLDDLTEVEDWIASGIPVIMSARWDWLLPGRPLDRDGHLIVCIGFTENGDVVVNDPATRLERGESVRRIYKRADVLHSWGNSHHAVYLVYPIGAAIPPNRYGQWD